MQREALGLIDLRSPAMSSGGYIHPPPSQPSNTNIITYSQALRHISSVRSRLSDTIQDYISACQLLASACADDPRSPHSQSHTIALAVDSELSAIEQEVEHMHGVRQVLIDARNRSKMTAPVYSLPVEILTRIFQEATCHDGHDESRRPCRHFSNPVTLSTVCRQWRNAAMACRPLWAHLDILVGSGRTNHIFSYPASKLWTRCLQDGPLQVHIRDDSFTLVRGSGYYDRLEAINYEDNWDKSNNRNEFTRPGNNNKVLDTITRTTIPKLVAFLAPLLKYVDSLEIISSQDYQGIPSLLLNYLIDSPALATRMKTVRVIHDEQCKRLSLRSSRTSHDSYNTEYQNFFSLLTKLDIRNAFPHWSHLKLTNLVELRLEAPATEDGWRINQTQLTAVLSSCAKLRSLIFFRVIIAPNAARVQPTQAVLHELRVLSVRCMIWSEVPELIFSMIAPGPYPLHMSIQLPEDQSRKPGFISSLRSFFARSNIAVLYVQAAAFNTWFASQLSPLPNAHTLALSVLQVSEISGRGKLRLANPSPIYPSTIIWPRLRTLYLISCGIEKRHFQQLLLLHNIQTLYLHRCYDDTLSQGYDSHVNTKFQDECKALVTDHIPNVAALDPAIHDETLDWLFVGTPM